MGDLRAIGLMSGTSMDGIDAALIVSDGESMTRSGHFISLAYEPGFRKDLETCLDAAAGLTTREARPEPLGEVEAELTKRHAQAVQALLESAGLGPEDISVIGFHGQTVLHRPEKKLTVQLGDGGLLAALAGVDVVCDFRASDMVAGGEGAPLAPVYHRACGQAAGLEAPYAFLNLGGVGNMTYVGRDDDMLAFDTGPANGPVDDWVMRHGKGAMDEDGRLALAGRADEAAIAQALRNPFFDRKPPKSLDRRDFDLSPVAGAGLEDGAATLTRLSAAAIVEGLRWLPEPPASWVISGGGARNPALLGNLAELLPGRVLRADDLGLSCDAMEAEAFAYMAVRHVQGLPITFPGTTGVGEPMTGGVLFKV